MGGAAAAQRPLTEARLLAQVFGFGSRAANAPAQGVGSEGSARSSSGRTDHEGRHRRHSLRRKAPSFRRLHGGDRGSSARTSSRTQIERPHEVGVPVSGRRPRLTACAARRTFVRASRDRGARTGARAPPPRTRSDRGAELSRLVEVYLAQHGGEPGTVEKLRRLLAKTVRAFGERRINQLRPAEIAAWRMTIPSGHRFEATQALRQVPMLVPMCGDRPSFGKHVAESVATRGPSPAGLAWPNSISGLHAVRHCAFFTARWRVPDSSERRARRSRSTPRRPARARSADRERHPRPPGSPSRSGRPARA